MPRGRPIDPEKHFNKYTADERETIINFNDEDDNALIATRSKAWIKMLDQMGFERVDQGYYFEYLVPKKLVAIRKERKITDEHRKKLSDNMRRVRKGSKDG